MKHLLLAALPLAMGLHASAQSLDLHSFSTLRKHRIETRHTGSSPLRSVAKDAARVEPAQLAFITIADGYSRTDLEKAGVNVLSARGPIAIVEVLLDDAEEISSLPCVKAMSLQRELSTNMDKAREEQHIDDILFNTPSASLPQAYTGAGVITGIVDQGIDPHHINFRYANGESRISYLAWLRYNATGNGMAENHYNYTTLGDFTTDDASSYHGTHTLGIMAGSYNGPVSVAKPWADPTVPEPTQYTTISNPYYGVAPEADIAVSCGHLGDAFVAYGMQYILNYADYAQKPLVYNLSLGSTSGPHDPRSQMSQFFDLVGKEAIICIAAGNEGDLKIALKKDLTEEDSQIKSLIYPFGFQYDPNVPGSYTARTGSVEIWSEDDTPFELKAVIYNKKRNYRAAYNMPTMGDNAGTYYVSSSDFQVSESDIIADPTFVKAFEGYVGVGVKVDEQTGRYYGLVDYYILNADTNLNDDYVLGFEVVGQPGKHIECYCDGLNTWLDNYGNTAFDDGSTDGSISDMAVANNVIVVGSYNTRNTWPCLDGGTSRYDGEGFQIGNVNGFSSYGTLADGRTLPTVCAPGSAIISSISWPFAKQLTMQDINYACSAFVEEDGRLNLWKQELGTSMATPFVSGSIALWLQANPHLTIDDVKEIIAKTSTVDDDVRSGNPAKWGAGKFNALAGLKEAIRMAGIAGVEIDNPNDHLIVTPQGGNTYNFFLGGAQSMNIGIYSVDGSLIHSSSYSGDEAVIDLSNLARGIYVVNANGSHSQKLYVK